MAITKNSQIDLNGNEMILDADGDTTITADTDDQIDFKTAGTDRVAIGASGNLFVGSSTSNGISGGTAGLQVTGAGFNGAISASRHDNNQYGSSLMLGKSRNTTVGSNTIVQDNDGIGAVTFFADDGTNLDSRVANISANVDGTPGENDTPGRLTFETTADGSAAPSERMRIDSSGNVGIGTTSPNTALHTASGSNSSGLVDVARFQNVGTSVDDGARIQLTSGTSTSGAGMGCLGYALNSAHLVFHSGGNNERMRIDQAGNVGIGTTNPTQKLEVTGNVYVGGGNYFTQATSGYFFGGSGSFSNGIYGVGVNNAAFNVNGSERMRIDSSGRLLIGQTAAIRTNDLLQVNGAEGINAKATANGGACFIGLESVGNSAGSTFVAVNTSAAVVFRVSVGGNVSNTNNSYGAISDIKLKENIVDATDKLSDIKQVKIRNFNFKGDDVKQIGVIAQELETIFPSLVTENDDIDENGNVTGTTKEVKYSVFVPILIKAIQEQQEQIEALQSEINTLKGE